MNFFWKKKNIHIKLNLINYNSSYLLYKLSHYMFKLSTNAVACGSISRRCQHCSPVRQTTQPKGTVFGFSCSLC